MSDDAKTNGTTWITHVVALGAAVVAAIGGLVYEDVKAWAWPDKISGPYASLAADEPGKPPEQSQLSLQSHDGVIKGSGQRGEKKWTYSGYLKNGFVVLSYRSTDSTGLGFGTYFLADPKGDAREYVGYYEGNVCPERRIYRCDVVLVKGNTDGPEVKAAVATYADLFNRKCLAVESFTTATSPNACPK